MKRPVLVSVGIGLLFALVVLTKTKAVFLAPAVGWAMVDAVVGETKAGAAVRAGGGVERGGDVWRVDGDRCVAGADARLQVLPGREPLYVAGGVQLAAGSILVVVSRVAVGGSQPGVAGGRCGWQLQWRGARNGAESSGGDPVFGAALLGMAGLVLFMTVQNHPQPRYFPGGVVPDFFRGCAGAANALVAQGGWARRAGWCVVGAAACASRLHATKTIGYAIHPEYTWVNAAAELTQYIDAHPNGKRLLVSVSGDDITLMTHLPALCDEIEHRGSGEKLERYEPGWFASWNESIRVTLSELHTRYSLEQVASFRALDDPDRNVLVLFKLHPLPGGKERDRTDPGMKDVMADDEIDVPVE